MSEAELSVTLKNARFEKDPADASKYVFGPIESIEHIGGSFKNDKNETVDFGDDITEKLTKDSLTERINEKMAPKAEVNTSDVVDDKTAVIGGARKSRKARRTKKGGKKRRSTQRRHRKSR